MVGNKIKEAAARKKKKKWKNRNKKLSREESICNKYVNNWLSSSGSSSSSDDDDDGFESLLCSEPTVFELHCHSTCSDGFLSPSALVQRAHRNGVKVLALTDHDTLAGIPEALSAARKVGMRVIPGVEISAMFAPRGYSGSEESVHILAYYGSCGPSKLEDIDRCLKRIRDGRYDRAKNMLSKLNEMKLPVKWERVLHIAGENVAPGRVHIARAMVEAGHVVNLKEAFNKYLHDDGPAYAKGNELLAEDTVELICRTGGVAALAHPWTLKNPEPVIRSLKAVGLHAMEVYRSDGKVAGFCDLADSYELVKLGGSDYHGKGEHNESDLGTVPLPAAAARKFLMLARPIWCNALKEILVDLAEGSPADGLRTMMEDFSNSRAEEAMTHFSQYWLTSEGKDALQVELNRLNIN